MGAESMHTQAAPSCAGAAYSLVSTRTFTHHGYALELTRWIRTDRSLTQP